MLLVAGDKVPPLARGVAELLHQIFFAKPKENIKVEETGENALRIQELIERRNYVSCCIRMHILSCIFSLFSWRFQANPKRSCKG
jgi:hypothetical protein